MTLRKKRQELYLDLNWFFWDLMNTSLVISNLFSHLINSYHTFWWPTKETQRYHFPRSFIGTWYSSIYVLLTSTDFMTDIVVVETADHARLSIKLSYNWFFEIDRSNASHSAKLFSVPDFVGDACKAIASRVRGAVAGVSFDAFHKNSAKVISSSVFGNDESGKTKNRLFFPGIPFSCFLFFWLSS